MSDIICTNPELNSPLNRASKDKFILILTVPQLLRRFSKQDPNLDIDTLQISIHGSVVPQITVPAIQAPIMGQVTNYSSHSRPNYSPLQVNFLVDNNYFNYYILWKWLDLLNSADTSIYKGTEERDRTKPYNLESGGLNNEYQTDFSVVGYNEYNEESIEFYYHRAFITSLGAINYSYRDADLLESTVEFQFSQLTMDIKNQLKKDK